MGTQGLDISAAYGLERNRSELRPGGAAWVLGGGGPMGHMHIQRMIEMEGGPRRVLVTETNLGRQAELEAGLSGMAQARGVELVVCNPGQVGDETLQQTLRRVHEGRGFDDIVVMVAKPDAVEQAIRHLAPDGMLAVFAGVPKGTFASLDISNIYLGRVQITGTSGSRISDQASVLDKVARAQLSTASAVAAIGGLDAARAGIQALMDGRFPGKVVIFPQVASFPLTPLAELKTVAPNVYERLSPAGTWTREAELEFLRSYGQGY